jgi:hypothetical protein
LAVSARSFDYWKTRANYFAVVIMRCPPLDSRICCCQPGKEPGNPRALPKFTDAFVTWLLSEIMFISFRKKTAGSAHKIKTAFRLVAMPSVHRSGIWALFRAVCVAVSQFPASVAQDAWRKTDRSLSVRRARFVLDFSRPPVPRPFSNLFATMLECFGCLPIYIAIADANPSSPAVAPVPASLTKNVRGRIF